MTREWTDTSSTIKRVVLAAALLIVTASVVEAQNGNGNGAKKEPTHRFEVYGFIMADMGQDFGQTHPDWFDVVRPTKLPAFEGEYGEDGRTFFSARQTRFGAKAWLPTSVGDLETTFEWEMFGTGVDAGQTTLRLRHAYAQLGYFGAGQYWSPFMDIDVFPNSIEYWGPNGMAFFRNVHVRYMPIQGTSRVTIALERPGASGDQGDFSDRIELDNVRGRFPLPDLSAEGRYGGDWGYVEAAGILRYMEWDDLLTDDAFDLSGDATGWGINLSSNLKFGRGRASAVRLSYLFGEGIQNYMNDAPADVGIRLNPGDPVRPIVGEALGVSGIVGFVDYYWTPKWSSSLGYSRVDIDNSDGQSDDAFKSGQYALLNVLHYPHEKVMVGAELQWGQRENFRDDFTVDTWRFQLSVRANYSIRFETQSGVAEK